jgi:phosphomannomutase
MSSLKFGTSGLRGLVVDLEGAPARRYVSAFLRHLEAIGEAGSGPVLIGWDLRASSPGIAADCAAAVIALGRRAVFAGAVPTPALALRAMAMDAPAIMVTGSHIPADRNGLKFYKPAGEIGKADEAGILVALSDDPGTGPGGAPETIQDAVLSEYLARYGDMLPTRALAGWRIGVFAHSSVARDGLGTLLSGYGAEVIELGRVETFVAVDTEAFDDAVFAPLPGWVDAQRLDAVVSTDGDGDRPLLMDGRKRFVRGDAMGFVAALFLESASIVTPVTSNSAIESAAPGRQVVRTRVGSPFVIAGMKAGAAPVVGFEANGGTLIGAGFAWGGHTVPALPTRDALLPMLAVLGQAATNGQSVADLIDGLELRAARAGRLTDIPATQSGPFLDGLTQADRAEVFFTEIGAVSAHNGIDGQQFLLEGGRMVHFRASGNAPELRCYVEAPSEDEADRLLAWGLESARAALAG